LRLYHGVLHNVHCLLSGFFFPAHILRCNNGKLLMLPGLIIIQLSTTAISAVCLLSAGLVAGR
ncbi:MAG: hypothetical protein J0M10_05220, partial [Chitinophagales bacterium]|nr:hypothetical protein [Chitinophagales bacterium]